MARQGESKEKQRGPRGRVGTAPDTRPGESDIQRPRWVEADLEPKKRTETAQEEEGEAGKEREEGTQRRGEGQDRRGAAREEAPLWQTAG